MGGLISVCMGGREPVCESAVLPSGEGDGQDPSGSGNGDGHLPGLASPTVVAWNARKLMRLATAFAVTRGELCSSSTDVICHDHQAILAGDRSSFVRQAASAAGISDRAVRQILRRWQCNAKRHDRPFRLYLAFCQAAGKCGICEAESQLVNYASSRLIDGCSGANFRAHMGALKQWLSLLVPSVRSSVWVASLEASVRVSHPDRVKYSIFYRLDKVWELLRDMGSISTLSIKQLRTRALTLLRIDLMARSADIARIPRGTIQGQTNPFFLPDGRMGVRFFCPKGLHSHWEWADGKYSSTFCF